MNFRRGSGWRVLVISMGRNLKVLLIVGFGLLVMCLLVFLAWTIFIVRPFERARAGPEDSARYYPADALAYVWFNPFAGSDDQALALRGHFERMKSLDSFGSSRVLVSGRVAEELGVSLDELLVWAGPDVSAAVLSVDGQDLSEFVVALVIQVRDEELALASVEKAVRHLAMRSETQILGIEYGEYAGWVGPGVGFALGDGILVVSNAESGVLAVLEVVRGERISLAEQDAFIVARESLLDGRIGGGYFAPKRFSELVEVDPAFEEFVQRRAAAGPDAAAFALVARDYGLRFDLASVVVGDGVVLSQVRMDAAELLSDETSVLLQFGFDPDVDVWREELAKIEFPDYVVADVKSGSSTALGLGVTEFWDGEYSDASDVLDEALEMGSMLVGIDIEDDLLGHLDGNLGLALGDFSLEEFDGESFGGTAFLGLEAESDGAMIESVGTLLDGAAAFLEVEELTLSEGRGWSLTSGGDQEAGVGVSRSWLIAATEVEWLDAALWGTEGSLAADGLFEETRRTVGDGRYLFGYLNGARAFRNFEDGYLLGGMPVVRDMVLAVGMSDGGSNRFYEKLSVVIMLDRVGSENGGDE